MTYAYGHTVECYELDGSPTESSTESSFKGTIKLRTPWASRYSLAAAIANYTLWPIAAGVAARARNISILPFTSVSGADGSTLAATYEWAVLTVDYIFDAKTPSADGSGNLFSESLEPTAQSLTCGWESYKWKTGGADLLPGEVPSKILRGMDYVFTRYNLAAIPAAALSLVGYCNNATVTAATLGLSFTAQTLLFNPPSLNRTVTFGASPSTKWTATYRFTYKPEGWNTFWNARKATPGWDAIQVKTAGGGYADYVQYPLGDFSGL